MSITNSERFFRRAQKRIPGGVNSPVRAWKAVGGSPLFARRGRGARLVSAEEKSYIDFVGSWGPLIFGHAYAPVVRAVNEAARRGMTFGAPTELEVTLAEIVSRRIPSVEKLRLVSSGTEAAMSAVRLARGFARRSKVIKFDGCYHGHADGMLARAGSGVATLGLPDSPGVPEGFAAETLVAPFNDIGAVERLFHEYPKRVAAVIVEPVCGNMGVIPPESNFLPALRALTAEAGAVLIFDEVITGFRVAPGGAQELYGVSPDLTCLGKILGGGLPLGAVGGKSKIMDLLAPEGPVYQAGTLSGNPLAVTAGLTTLKELSRREVYRALEEKGKRLQKGFENVLQKYGIEVVINRVGSMLTLFFGLDRVRNADDARNCDRQRFARFFHGMLERGVYFPPSPFEAAFVSLAHGEPELSKTVAAFDDWASDEVKG